jgi:hypothetical protein
MCGAEQFRPQQLTNYKLFGEMALSYISNYGHLGLHGLGVGSIGGFSDYSQVPRAAPSPKSSAPPARHAAQRGAARSAPMVPSAAPVLKRDNTPPNTTLYLRIVLGSEDPAHAMTGVFIPNNFRAEPQVDIILYLHGYHRSAPSLSIDGYWNRAVQPHFDFREGLNATGKNVILVAPTLGPSSQAGRLMSPGALDWYLDTVRLSLAQHGPHQSFSGGPNIRHLILACHSGGGWPMRRVATSPSRYAANVRECWGFDCLYNGGDEDVWARWATDHPFSRVYIHYGNGNTARKSELLRAKHVPNVFVEGRTSLAHNFVPRTHWQDRLRAAAFLQNV